MNWITRNEFAGQQIAPPNEWRFTATLPQSSPPLPQLRWSPPPHRVLRNPEGSNPFEVQQSENRNWSNFPEDFRHGDSPRFDDFQYRQSRDQFPVARRSIHDGRQGQFNDVTCWEQQQFENYSGFNFNENFQGPQQINNRPNLYFNGSLNGSNSYAQEGGAFGFGNDNFNRNVPPFNPICEDGQLPYFTGNNYPRPPLEGRRMIKAARGAVAKKKNKAKAPCPAEAQFSHIPKQTIPQPNAYLVQIQTSKIPEVSVSNGQAFTDDVTNAADSLASQPQASANPEVRHVGTEDQNIAVVPGDTQRNASNPASSLPQEPATDVNSRKRKRTDDEYLESLDKVTSEIVLVTQPFSTPSPRQPDRQKPRFESNLAIYSGFFCGDHMMPTNPGTPEKLYHYTTWEGCVGILHDRYIGLSPTSIIKFGFGIYFTKIAPDESTEDIVYNNFNTKSEAKYAKTEYCFEFLSADLPDLTFCIEHSSHYASSNCRKDRDVWKSTVHRLYLDRTKGVYYRRELDGPRRPKFIEMHRWDLTSQVPTSNGDGD